VFRIVVNSANTRALRDRRIVPSCRPRRWALVLEAIGGLPPGQRAVITLRDVRGWSAAEVRRSSSSPAGTTGCCSTAHGWGVLRGPLALRSPRRHAVVMEDEVKYVSRVRVVRLRGPVREAHLPAEEDPVVFSTHGAVREHYGTAPGQFPERATTLDYLVAAAAG
jgi:hypothetical protein